jgi:hypothetical protein
LQEVTDINMEGWAALRVSRLLSVTYSMLSHEIQTHQSHMRKTAAIVGMESALVCGEQAVDTWSAFETSVSSVGNEVTIRSLNC